MEMWSFFFILGPLLLQGAVKAQEVSYAIELCSPGSEGIPRENRPNTSEVYVFLSDPAVLDCEGKLATWQVYAQTDGRVHLDVWRPDMAYDTLSWVGKNIIEIHSKQFKPGFKEIPIPMGHRMTVEPGDLLGFHYPAGTDPEKYVIPLTTTAVYSGTVSHVMRLPGNDGNLPREIRNVSFTGEEGNYAMASIKARVRGYNNDLRLEDGPSPMKGRAEALQLGQWGTICAVNYTSDPGQVAKLFCLELGFPDMVTSGNVTSTSDVGAADSSSAIHLQSPYCDVQEDSTVTVCPLKQSGSCQHDQDIYVQCSPSVRLANGTSDGEGVAQFYEEGQWGVICDSRDLAEIQSSMVDGWPNVLCKELGFDQVSEISSAVDEIPDFDTTQLVSLGNPSCGVSNPAWIRQCPTAVQTDPCSATQALYLVCQSAQSE